MQNISWACPTKKNERAFFIGLVNVDANNVISPWNFLKSDWHFALTSFEMGKVIGQSNCLLPILGVSLAGKRRSSVLNLAVCYHLLEILLAESLVLKLPLSMILTT